MRLERKIVRCLPAIKRVAGNDMEGTLLVELAVSHRGRELLNQLEPGQTMRLIRKARDHASGRDVRRFADRRDPDAPRPAPKDQALALRITWPMKRTRRLFPDW